MVKKEEKRREREREEKEPLTVLVAIWLLTSLFDFGPGKCMQSKRGPSKPIASEPARLEVDCSCFLLKPFTPHLRSQVMTSKCHNALEISGIKSRSLEVK